MNRLLCKCGIVVRRQICRTCILTRTEELLVLRLEGCDAGLELVPPALVHLILLLHLSKAVDGLANEGLGIGQAPPEGDDVLVRERGDGLVGVDGIELRENLAQLLVFL